jgi:hypothetical protein
MNADLKHCQQAFRLGSFEAMYIGAYILGAGTQNFLDKIILSEPKFSLYICMKEKPPLHLWNTLAREYYRQQRYPDFVKILEAGINFKFKDYDGYDKDQMAAYDTLAAYFVQVNMAFFRHVFVTVFGLLESKTKKRDTGTILIFKLRIKLLLDRVVDPD